MSETADERLNRWQRMGGSSRWGIGAAADLVAIEARVTALESSRAVQSAPEAAAEEANDPGREGDHFAAGSEMVGTAVPAASEGFGDGYRWVKVGEALEPGDELRIKGRWVRTRYPGSACDEHCTYRRRIAPSEAVPDDAGRRLVNGEPMTAAEMQHALTVARQEIARLKADRNEAMGEIGLLTAQRDTAREEVTRHKKKATAYANIVHGISPRLGRRDGETLVQAADRFAAELCAQRDEALRYVEKLRGYLASTKEAGGEDDDSTSD